MDDDVLEAKAGKMLISKKLSLAVAESFTAGSLMQLLAGAPESNRFLKGGFYTATDEAKLTLGLVHDAGSGENTAVAMASLARDKMQAGVGIAIEGYAETVDNVQMAKVFIAIVGPEPLQPLVLSYSGRLTQVVGRVAFQALIELRKYLSY